ncbi:MAG: carbohydrate porin [Phycisphaerales bacterium]
MIATPRIATSIALACLLAPEALTQDNRQPAPEPAAASSTPVTTTTAEPAAPTGILPIPAYEAPLFERSFLLGDLGGARSDLAEHGVQFRIDWIQHLQSVTSGGNDTGTRYAGSLDYLVNLDLQKMDLLPGALLTIRGESRYGESINPMARALLPVNTDLYFPLTDDPDDGLPIAITELTYTQFLSPTFALFIGKLNTLGGDPNEFASGRGMLQFGNSDFIFNPVTALTVPYSTLGAGALWIPCEHVTLTASVFNTNDASTTTGFSDIGDGYTISVESQFKYTIAGLHGGQNLGFTYAADQEFFDLNSRFTFDRQVGFIPPTEDETWSLYWSAWQYLWADESDETPIDLANGIPDRRGFGFFARAGLGDDDTMPIDWFASGGLGGRGLIPTRPDDHFGIAYAYTSIRTGNLASALGVDDHAHAFEAFYNAALTPAARLTASLQAVDDALEQSDTAIVLALRLHLAF